MPMTISPTGSVTSGNRLRSAGGMGRSRADSRAALAPARSLLCTQPKHSAFLATLLPVRLPVRRLWPAG